MRYAVVWAVFLGAVAALHRGEHMVLTLLDELLGRRGRRLLHGLVMLLVAAFCAVVVVFGTQLALRNWNQVSPTMNLRMFWPYLAVPTGAALMLFQSLVLGLLARDRALDGAAPAERSSATR
jgi:TRAP-type C4-dicarboxylate transport system permease small subunit